jgi:ribosomal protein S27AE
MSKSIVETTQAKTIEVVAPSAATWHVTFATGQTGGPFTEDEIRSMIARQQIKITDSVIATGGATWVPITQSPFARYIVTQATVDRLAASTCPQCGAAMAVVLQRSKAGLVLVIIGLITTPLFGIGIPIFIVGFILRWGFKPKAKYQCPRCNYRT